MPTAMIHRGMKAPERLSHPSQKASRRGPLPGPCVHEFLGIISNVKIMRPPTPMELAIDQVAAWAESATLVFLAESAGHLATLRQLALAGRVHGARIHDARIAAICLQHGVRELWTADRDFSLFPDLKTRNPMVSRN